VEVDYVKGVEYLVGSDALSRLGQYQLTLASYLIYLHLFLHPIHSLNRVQI
jgi:hypothetical protein